MRSSRYQKRREMRRDIFWALVFSGGAALLYFLG
jgi:hypothetical protein